MDIFAMVKDWQPVKVTDPKTAVSTIATQLIEAENIRFCDRVAYLRCPDCWRRVDDDGLVDVIKYLVGSEMALTLPESVFTNVLKKLQSAEKLRIDWRKVNEGHVHEVNLLNGIYDVRTRKLAEHSRDRPFTYVLNASYKPNAKLEQAPYFKRYIESSVGMENYECLMRMIGYALSSLIKGRKAFVLQGKGGTGKSTLLNLLEAIVTEEFVAREPFKTMGSANSIARYVDKRINISRENGVTPMRNDDGFKSLISCEGITGRDVYTKAVSFVPTLKFIFGSNHDLCFAHPDDAVYDRLIVILFTREIKEVDRDLDAKLYAERDVIVSLALDTLKDLLESGYDFKESEESKRYITIKRKALHSVESFLEETCEISADSGISRVDLMRAYELWCDLNGIECIGRNEFYDRVRRWNTQIRDRKVLKGSSRVNGFTGIRMKTELAESKDAIQKSVYGNVPQKGQVSES